MAQLQDPARLGVFADTAFTQFEQDDELDALVAQATRLAGTPIALLSLVIDRVQLFRSHVGLPAELAISQATSRCDSFCQFVVQDEAPLIIEEAAGHPRLPQHLVETYGLRSYMGVPVRYRDQVIGSLCVLDLHPRSFAPDLVPQLESLARSITIRLEELAREVTGKPEPMSAVQQAAAIEVSLLEVGPLLRLGQALARGQLGPDEFQRAISVLTELSDVHDDLLAAARRLHRTLLAASTSR